MNADAQEMTRVKAWDPTPASPTSLHLEGVLAAPRATIPWPRLVLSAAAPTQTLPCLDANRTPAPKISLAIINAQAKGATNAWANLRTALFRRCLRSSLPSTPIGSAAALPEELRRGQLCPERPADLAVSRCGIVRGQRGSLLTARQWMACAAHEIAAKLRLLRS